MIFRHIDMAAPETGLTTRIAVRQDLDTVASLLLATNRHYWGVRDGAEAASRHAAEALLADDADCRMLLGFLHDMVVAYATFAILHPAPNEHGVLFMKDLFVLDGGRGRGVGEAMMRRIAGLAVERGCHRFDWTAETDNPRALAFYDRLAADRVTEKVYFRFAGARLADFAKAISDD